MNTQTANFAKKVALPAAAFLVSFVVVVIVGVSTPLEGSARVALAGIYIALSVVFYLWFRSNAKTTK
jgi:drug/metabolite transporter superfamily protein YnfA